MSFLIQPLGDSAITVSFGNSIDEAILQNVINLNSYLTEKSIEGVKDIIPAYTTLTVVYDIEKVRKSGSQSAYKCMCSLIEESVNHMVNLHYISNRTISIPVCYHDSLGLDLATISQQKQLDVKEIIHLHTSVTYRVYMIGFLPGFAYMGKVDDKIATARKSVPSKNVLAGSVGIADAQTGIYPFDSPGGWHIIGRTPEPLFYPHLKEPCLFRTGDLVEFKPISLEQFNELKQA